MSCLPSPARSAVCTGRYTPRMRTGNLRLRITRPLSGSIDGIQLERFHAGCVYEFGVTIGSYLLAIGAAEPVEDDAPAVVLPPDQQMFGPIAKGHGYTVQRDQAADRKKKTRK